jgi:hypothetical protein
MVVVVVMEQLMMRKLAVDWIDGAFLLLRRNRAT